MKKITSVLLSIFILTVISCKNEQKGFLGPALMSANANFKVESNLALQSGGKSVIFNLAAALSKNVFVATFNQPVSWQIVISGDSSTGIKTLSGTTGSDGKLSALWDGSHDGTYYFEDGEMALATLSVAGWAATDTFSFKIVNARPTQSTDTNGFGTGFINPGTGYLLATRNMNFEPAPLSGFPSKYIGSVFAGALQNYSFDVGSTYGFDTIVRQNDVIRAPEGKYFLRIAGTFKNPSAEPNGIFIDGVQGRNGWGQNFTQGNVTRYMLPSTWTDPTQIYLNIWVRGIDHLPPGYTPDATINFEVDEDDNGLIANGPYQTAASSPGQAASNPNIPVNCNQTTGDNWCPCNEDGWFLKIPVRHQGWKLFSCRYSDLLQDEDGLNGGNGNRIMEPHKVVRVQIGMNATIPWSQIQADVDMACFTYGGPLKPNDPY